MDAREKLVDLIIDAKRTDPETGSFTEYLADYLISNGVTVQEWISVEDKLPPKEEVKMRLCDLDEIKVCVDRQYENCHGYSGSNKAIYREAILAVKSILHSAKPIDAVPVVRCQECKHRKNTLIRNRRK